MSTSSNQQTTGTLGLTGLTVNAMALIAPGAFLWLTFQIQSLYGAPLAGQSMWFGILAALALCLATAYSYAELSKIYPGAGSSYLYAEQAFLSKTKAAKFARIVKFFTGWASHLYYWVYPGCMVGVTALIGGYLLNQFWPDTFSPAYNSPLFMVIFCVVFSFFVSWIASRGVTGSTGVNVAVNVIQITALTVFAVIAISYRVSHKQDSVGWHLSNGTAITYQVAQSDVTDDKGAKVQDTWADGSPKFQVDDKGKQILDKDGKPVPAIKQQDRQVAADDLDKAKNTDAASLAALTALGVGVGDPYPLFQVDDKGKEVLDKNGAAIPVPFTVSYKPEEAVTGAGTAQDPTTFNFHPTATSVVAPHSFFFVFIQACVAILILVGFESVTAMGEEAKNAKKDVPRAILLSLIIQGAICYMFEYFAANYLLHNGYTLSNAGASGAPIGDLMVITGSWLFGSYSAGRWFMLIQAFTVFLALIGTTLSCMNTGARVTYAMGRDEEVGSHFGLLHGKTGAPTRAIWTLAVLSAIIGIITVSVYLGGTSPSALDPKYHNIWYSFGIFAPEAYPKIPNTLVIVTLVSNFGTFMLYMMTCIVTIVAFIEHNEFHGFKHIFIPVFGAVANFACMLFYIIGPQFVTGMSPREPFWALGVAAVWGLYGVIYFVTASKKKAKPMFVDAPPAKA
jgi:basic amino acid/polyamine antiporter, APA family